MILLMVIPSFMVIHFRTKLSSNRFTSFIETNIVAYGIGLMGLVFAIYNCYVAVMNIINGYNAFTTLITGVMGAGPLVIPPALGQVGFLLGVSVLFIFALLSALTAEYVIEV